MKKLIVRTDTKAQKLIPLAEGEFTLELTKHKSGWRGRLREIPQLSVIGASYAEVVEKLKAHAALLYAESDAISVAMKEFFENNGEWNPENKAS